VKRFWVEYRAATTAALVAGIVAVAVTAGLGARPGEVAVHQTSSDGALGEETTTTAQAPDAEATSTTTASAAPKTIDERVTDLEHRVTVIEQVVTTTTLPPGPPVPEGCTRTQSGWTCPPPLPSPFMVPLRAEPHPGGVTVSWDRYGDPDGIINYEVSVDGGPRQAAPCCTWDIADTPGTTVDVWAWRFKTGTSGERLESDPRRYTVPKITSITAELRSNNVVVTLTGVGEVPAGSVTVRITYEASLGRQPEVRTMSYSAFTGQTSAWYPPSGTAVAVELLAEG